MSAMKNHIMVNRQILQTNKKWSHLKRKQQAWIYEITREEHSAYVREYGKLPQKRGKEAVLYKIHDRIDEREIWIP
jgi:phage shock protein A